MIAYGLVDGLWFPWERIESDQRLLKKWARETDMPFTSKLGRRYVARCMIRGRRSAMRVPNGEPKRKEN